MNRHISSLEFAFFRRRQCHFLRFIKVLLLSALKSKAIFFSEKNLKKNIYATIILTFVTNCGGRHDKGALQQSTEDSSFASFDTQSGGRWTL